MTIAISSVLAADRDWLGKRSHRLKCGIVEFDRGVDGCHADPGICHPAHPHGQDELHAVSLRIAVYVRVR